MSHDLLTISPHPDDAELYCGGLIRKMSDLGHATAIVDLTAGEMGTRGTVEDRMQESDSAAEILGLQSRMNLRLPDSGIVGDEEQRLAVIRAIRELRPHTVLLPTRETRHPDHRMTGVVGQDAAFLAGLHKINTGQEPYRPQQLVFYFTHYTYRQESPSFVVDITEQFDRKIQAVKAFKSQFHNPESSEPSTFISRPEFLDDIEAVNRFYGTTIGTRYGEPYVVREILHVDDPVTYFGANTER